MPTESTPAKGKHVRMLLVEDTPKASLAQLEARASSFASAIYTVIKDAKQKADTRERPILMRHLAFMGNLCSLILLYCDWVVGETESQLQRRRNTKGFRTIKSRPKL